MDSALLLKRRLAQKPGTFPARAVLIRPGLTPAIIAVDWSGGHGADAGQAGILDRQLQIRRHALHKRCFPHWR